MNGVKSNNGQVLLLLVLVMGTLLIVAMTAIFQSTSSTQLGGIDQQSQITLAAAEAAIEKALQTGESGTFAQLGLTTLDGINLSTSRVQVQEERTYTFVTQKLEKDEQYTFYLAEYTGTYPNYFGQTYDLDFHILYESALPDCSDIALEMTVIYDEGGADGLGDADTGGGYEMEKYIIDAGNQITTDDSKELSEGAIASTTFDKTTFTCRTRSFSSETHPNTKVVLLQTFFKGTALGFAVAGYELLPGTPPPYQLPPQGRTVTATARAVASAGVTTASGPTPTPLSGLTRSAQVFQSYPQIPAEFWVTSF